MTAGAILSGVGAVTGIAGGLFGGKKAKKEAKRQRRLAQQIQREVGLQSEAALRQFDLESEIQRIAQIRANVQTQQERTSQIREARIRRAQIQQAAANAGVGRGTSTVAGAVGGLTTALGRNLGLINVAQGFAERFSQLGEQVSQQQRLQLESQGRINVLQAQGQVSQARTQSGLATGQLISGIGESLFSIGQQGFGGFQSIFNPRGFSGVPSNLSNVNVPGVR